jgi:hypothetical protein
VIRHEIYWGSHGCHRNPGHTTPCKCSCGELLPEGRKYVFGDQADTAVFMSGDLEPIGYMLQLRTETLGWADVILSQDREEILRKVQEENEQDGEDRWRVVERLDRVIS